MNYNKLIICGRVARNADGLEYAGAGNPFYKFTIASSRKVGEREEVCYLDCVSWGKTAELCSQYLSKGRECLVEGTLRLESWEDRQTGQKRSKHTCSVMSVQFGALPRSKQETCAESAHTTQGGGYSEQYHQAKAQRGTQKGQGNYNTPCEDEDIPF